MQKLFWSSVFVFCLNTSFAQIDKESIKEKIINQNQPSNTESKKTRRPFLISGKNFISKYNPVKLFFAGSLYFYQNAVSQQFYSNCPYHVSCSEYSKQSIKRFGMIKGIFMTADRLTRCNGYALNDIDMKHDILNSKVIDDPWEY